MSNIIISFSILLSCAFVILYRLWSCKLSCLLLLLRNEDGKFKKETRLIYRVFMIMAGSWLNYLEVERKIAKTDKSTEI